MTTIKSPEVQSGQSSEKDTLSPGKVIESKKRAERGRAKSQAWGEASTFRREVPSDWKANKVRKVVSSRS